MVKADFLEQDRGDRIKVTLSEKNMIELSNGRMLHGLKIDVEMEAKE